MRIVALIGLAAMGARFITTDLREKRIYNRDVLLSAAVIAALYGLLMLHTWWADVFASSVGSARFDFLPWEHFQACARHAAVALAMSLTLWVFRIWPAGDAKLYFLLAVLLPLIDPSGLALSYRLPLALLVNIFIPAAFVILLRSVLWLWTFRLRHGFAFYADLGRSRVGRYIVDTAREAWRDGTKELRAWREKAKTEPAEAVKTGLSFGAVALFGGLVLAHLQLTMPWYRYFGPVAGFAVVIAWRWLKERFSEETLSGLVAVGAVGAMAAGGKPFWEVFRVTLLQWSFFSVLFQAGTVLLRHILTKKGEGFTTFLFILGTASSLGLLPVLFPFLFTGLARSTALWAFFGIVFGVVYALVYSALEENVIYCPTERIHPRLVLASAAWDGIRRDEAFYRENFRWRYPDGLTASQAESLKKWCRERSMEAIAVRKPEPFAIWVFTGMLLTLVMKGDVVSYCVSLLK